jgi:hypothetical protein
MFGHPAPIERSEDGNEASAATTVDNHRQRERRRFQGIDPLDRIVFPQGQTHFAMSIIMPRSALFCRRG